MVVRGRHSRVISGNLFLFFATRPCPTGRRKRRYKLFFLPPLQNGKDRQYTRLPLQVTHQFTDPHDPGLTFGRYRNWLQYQWKHGRNKCHQKGDNKRNPGGYNTQYLIPWDSKAGDSLFRTDSPYLAQIRRSFIINTFCFRYKMFYHLGQNHTQKEHTTIYRVESNTLQTISRK